MQEQEWFCEKHRIKGINPLGCYRCIEEKERGFCVVCGKLGCGSYKGVIFCSPDCEEQYFSADETAERMQSAAEAWYPSSDEGAKRLAW